MKTPSHSQAGFTLIELFIACSIGAVIAAGALVFGAFGVRLMARNMATNHSHDTIRVSVERMISDLHGSASVLQLVNYDGTSYTDATPVVTSDQDPFSTRYLSTRANAVRFYRYGGGPYKLLSDSSGATSIPSTAVSLKFEFGPLVNGDLPYYPSIGDKMQLPLIAREFTITAVNTAPTKTVTTGTITLSSSVGFNLYTAGTTPAGVTNPITTGHFYEVVGYSVWNSQLRYHRTFPPAVAADTMVVRDNVTSPKPFALLFPTASSSLTDCLNLRVSLEAYDQQYGLPLFKNSTTTLQAVIPSRTQPITLNSN